jgi:hypothetical protein
MVLEFRPTEPEGSLDLYDETGKVGEIEGPNPETDVDPDGTPWPPMWAVTLWSLTGSGKTWGNVTDSLDDAYAEARGSYEELVAERREVGRGSVRAIPTPMGGQKRRR